MHFKTVCHTHAHTHAHTHTHTHTHTPFSAVVAGDVTRYFNFSFAASVSMSIRSRALAIFLQDAVMFVSNQYCSIASLHLSTPSCVCVDWILFNWETGTLRHAPSMNQLSTSFSSSNSTATVSSGVSTHTHMILLALTIHHNMPCACFVQYILTSRHLEHRLRPKNVTYHAHQSSLCDVIFRARGVQSDINMATVTQTYPEYPRKYTELYLSSSQSCSRWVVATIL